MTRDSTRRSALLAMVTLVVIWACSWIVMKEVMRYSGPLDFSALRYLGGAVVLVLVCAVRGESLKPTPIRLTIAVGLCQTTAFQAFSQWALVAGGAGRVSMLAYTMPFWAVLFAWALMRETPTPRLWFGLGLAAVGLVGVMEPWRGLGTLHSTLLALASGAFWGLGTVLSKRMFDRHSPSPLAFTTWQMLFGGVVLAIIALLVPSRPIEWTPEFIAGLAYSIVLASSFAWVLWLYVVKNLPATVAGLSSLGVPVTVVLLAWILLRERPDAVEVAGIVLILAGLLAVLGFHRRSAA